MSTNVEKTGIIEKQETKNFIKNVMTLVSGSAVAQIIPIAASPVIARLYSPEEFGLFGIYMSVVSILVIFSCLKYEAAIMLPKDKADAQSLFYLCIIILASMSILSAFIIFVFNDFIAQKLNFNEKFYLFLIPMSLFVVGLTKIFSVYNSRNKYFGNISGSKVFGSAFNTGFKLFFSAFSALALIGGSIIGHLVQFFILFFGPTKNKIIEIKDFSLEKIISNAKRYKNFAIYPVIASVFGALSRNSTVIFLGILYSPEVAGFYALSSRIVSFPAGLISTSVADVFYQKASQTFNEKGDLKSLYKKTTLALVKLSFIPFLFLLFLGPQFFSLLFGQTWLTAGIYAQLSAISVLMIFINPPAGRILNVLEIHTFRVFYQAALFILTTLGILTGYFIFNSHFYSVGLYALASAICNLFFIIYIYNSI